MLCDILAEEIPTARWEGEHFCVNSTNADGNPLIRRAFSFPPSPVTDLAELDEFTAETLAEMNDHGKTFAEIATYIEENL